MFYLCLEWDKILSYSRFYTCRTYAFSYIQRIFFSLFRLNWESRIFFTNWVFTGSLVKLDNSKWLLLCSDAIATLQIKILNSFHFLYFGHCSISYLFLSIFITHSIVQPDNRYIFFGLRIIIWIFILLCHYTA